VTATTTGPENRDQVNGLAAMRLKTGVELAGGSCAGLPETLLESTEHGESFWTAVHPLIMDREITRANVRDIVALGLQETRGTYKIVAGIFNMEARDYKRFLNFLRKHDCQIPFKDYR